MATRLDFRDRWVLVTGASSGLGAEMARQLAKQHGAHLVLSARRVDRLEALRRELEPAQVVVIPADLAREGEADRLFGEASNGRTLHAAILNAGVTWFGPSMQLPWEQFQAMLATNVVAPVRLARLFLAGRSEGGLLFVASLAGLLPVPWQADYAGGKAFLASFGQSLAHEHPGIAITTFAPGGIATEMLTGTNLSKVAKPGDFGVMGVERCARLGLDAFRKRKRLYVPGVVNKLTLALQRLLPRQVVLRVTARIYEKGLS